MCVRVCLPALDRKCVARSLSPFSVMTSVGLKAAIWEHNFSMYSSSMRSKTALEGERIKGGGAVGKVGVLLW